MIDGRLFAPALAAWIAAAIVVFAQTSGLRSWLLPTVLVGLATLAVVLLRWGRRRPGLRLLILGSAIAALLGGASASARIANLTAEPVNAWTRNGATATVVAQVASDPVRREPPGGAWWPARLEMRLDASTIQARGLRVDVGVPVVIQAPTNSRLPPVGSLIVVRGRLAQSPRMDVAAVIRIADDAVTVIAPPGPVHELTNRMRAGLRAALMFGPRPGAALVAGLAIGDESMQQPELTDAMRASGLAHLTAVSGGNVAILLAVVVMLASLMRLRLRGRVVLSLLAIAGFVLLVRPEPSVVRAAIMGSVAVLAVLTGGRRTGPAILSFAVLVVVLVFPMVAVSWGFALSTFATAGLILIAPTLRRRLDEGARTQRFPDAVRDAIAVTLAAQVATLPLLISMGNAVGWVALPANLLAMPAVAPVTILGLFAAVISPIAPWLAATAGTLASWPGQWIAWVAMWASGLPLASLPWPSGWGGLAWLTLACVLMVVVLRIVSRLPDELRAWMRHPVVRIGAGASLVTLLVLLVVAPLDRRNWPPDGWTMIVCDVGQGDAIVLNAGDGSAVVVDTGPEPRSLDECLTDAGVVAVPLLVLTHFHADHVDGIDGLRDRPIGAALATTLDEPAEQAARTFAWLADRDVPTARMRMTQRVKAGEVEATVRWPARILRTGSAPNNASIVLDAEVDGVRMLLTGDIETAAQAAVRAGGPAGFDVIKVPHHGSASIDERFAEWTGARLALVSVGEGNAFGHPARDTMAMWARQALVARTDLNGDLAVVRTSSGVGLVRRDN